MRKMTASRDRGQFADLLRQYRTVAGYSQEQLAERAGLSHRGVSDLERGQRRAPHPETVRRLADALGLDVVDRAALSLSVRPEAAVTLDHPSLPPLPLSSTSFVGRDRELAEVR